MCMKLVTFRATLVLESHSPVCCPTISEVKTVRRVDRASDMSLFHFHVNLLVQSRDENFFLFMSDEDLIPVCLLSSALAHVSLETLFSHWLN